MFLRVPLLFVLIGSLALPAASQIIRPQSGRRVDAAGTVSGTVRTTDDKPVADARVELRDATTGAAAASGYTNQAGGFEFPNVASGNYEVVVSSGLDEARDHVAVSSDVATVNLHLTRLTSDDRSAGNNSTVSVAQLKVPEKARDENKKAQEAMRKRDVAAAWKHVSKALEITPQFAGGLTTRALLELDQDKPDAAIADLENAVKLDAGYGLSFLVLGAAYNQLRHFDDAIRALDHGVALMTNYWQGYFELAKSYLGKNDLSHAREQLDRCSQQAPADYAPLHLVKANLDLAIHDYPAAMTELEAYLDREPNSPNSEGARKALGEVKAFLAKK